MSGNIAKAEAAWRAACKAWSADNLDQIEETMRLGEVMMFAATDYICALQARVETGPCVDDVASVSEPIQGLGEVGSVLNIEPGLRNAAPERRPAGEPIENGPTLFVAPEVEAEAHGRIPTTALAHRHTDADIEAICRAHDQEDAAQRGEPSPWQHYDCDGECDDCREFRASRIAAMRAGLEAVATLQGKGQSDV